jgi:hypothetical protein
MKLVPVALAAGVLCFYASSAAAAPASFCGTAKGVAAALVHSGNSLTPTATTNLATFQKRLKATYASLLAAKPALIGSAPASIKADLQKTFSFISFINTKMNSVGWDFTKVTPFAQQLVAKAKAAQPALLHLSAYFRGSCHIKGA